MNPKYPRWEIYIPEEGHWPIRVKNSATKAEARAAYLKWAERKRLPAGSFICDMWSMDSLIVLTD